MDLKFKKLRNVKTPLYSTAGSAGIDFFVPKDFSRKWLTPHRDILIPSGICAKVPEGYALVAFNKSGQAVKGLQVGACVIDSDYIGEIHLHVRNTSSAMVLITPDMKLVQFLLMPVATAHIIECQGLTFEPTERNDGGFGSTGEK